MIPAAMHDSDLLNISSPFEAARTHFLQLEPGRTSDNRAPRRRERGVVPRNFESREYRHSRAAVPQ
jgi:hypothetical protein